MALFKIKDLKEKLPKVQFAGLTIFFNKFKKSYVKFMTNLGAHVFHLGRYAIYKLAKNLQKYTKIVKNKTSILLKKIPITFKNYLSKRFAKLIAFNKHLKILLVERRKKKGLLSAIILCISELFKSVVRRKGFFTTVFNYVAPVISIVFLVSIVSYGAKVPYGLSVECNGQVLGYIDNETQLDQATKEMQDRITYVDGDAVIAVQPKLSVQKLSAKNDVYNASQLADKMISNSETPVIQAYGFYVNDQFKGAVTDKTSIEATLNDILTKYKTDVAGEKVQFVDKFEFKTGLYVEKGIIDPNTIVQTLTGQKQVEAYYTIVAGDAPTSIAQKVGIPYANLKALNPTIEASCKVGDKLVLNRSEPSVSVRITRTEEYDISLPYNTVKAQDATKYKGTETVLTQGVAGSAHISADVSYINSNEESRKIIKQDVVTAPVDKKVAVGTKSTGASPADISASGGGYMKPVSGAYISRGFAGGHTGIDFVAPQGTPIYAAADGVVTKSSYSTDGYGKSVVISHGNGWATLYGHASALLVSVGQTVKKGDIIARVGNTGNSQGNHCHFEVRHYNARLNPAGFLIG